jgi:hypothetical protein
MVSPDQVGVPSGLASQSTLPGPPSTGTVFSLPSEKYAIDFPSDDHPTENACSPI